MSFSTLYLLDEQSIQRKTAQYWGYLGWMGRYLDAHNSRVDFLLSESQDPMLRKGLHLIINKKSAPCSCLNWTALFHQLHGSLEQNMGISSIDHPKCYCKSLAPLKKNSCAGDQEKMVDIASSKRLAQILSPTTRASWEVDAALSEWLSLSATSWVADHYNHHRNNPKREVGLYWAALLLLQYRH